MANAVLHLGLLLLLLTCSFASIKGGPAERMGSLMILAAYIGDAIAVDVTMPHAPKLVIFITDFLLATGLLVIAVRYTSLWLGCAMLVQSVALCSYGLAATGEGLHGRPYVILNNALSLLMLACIIAGTLASWRRRVQARKADPGRTMTQTALA